MEKFEWLCSKCNTKVYHKKSVPRHKKDWQGGDSDQNTFNCLICSKGFNRKDAFTRHVRSCSSQYKSSQHFHHLQDLSNAKNAKVIRAWSVSGHGKGKWTMLVVLLRSL